MFCGGTLTNAPSVAVLAGHSLAVAKPWLESILVISYFAAQIEAVEYHISIFYTLYILNITSP